MPRHWTPYEQTQLARAGLLPDDFTDQLTTPVEYLTGQVEFCGHLFEVSPAVLIPRVETEELVEHAVRAALKQANGLARPVAIADVGCGSGAIGLSVAAALSQRYIPHELVLSDISIAALAHTEINREKLRPVLTQTQHITILESDLLKDYRLKLPTRDQDFRFDLILANLPYIPSARILTLDPSVREHEPHLALDGGPQGLEYIHKLLQQAPQYLANGGSVWLEIDETHTLADFTHLPGYRYTLLQDQFGKHRFIAAEYLGDPEEIQTH